MEKAFINILIFLIVFAALSLLSFGLRKNPTVITEEKVLEIAKKNKKDSIEKGKSLEAKNQFEKAEEIYREIIKMYPTDQ